MKKLRRWLGLEKRSEYVNKYFDTANFRSSIYMSVVIIIMELWMLGSLIKRWLEGDPTRSKAWFAAHLTWYTIFLVTALCMLFFAVFYLKGTFKKRLPGNIIMVIFSGVALYFGINISYSDYTKGEQILCFVMMIVFVVGLINWRPIISILASSFVFVLFYVMMLKAPEVEMTYATKVNFFSFWVATVMLGLAVYNQRLTEAESDESLEKSMIMDDLTGIANMHYFRKKAAEILKEEGYEDKIFLFLDIANFKAYNEEYGYDAGSLFIKNLAGKVENYFKDDLYARFSDDRFVVLTSKKGVEAKAKRLVTDAENLLHTAQVFFKVGAYAPKSADTDPAIACDHARYASSTIKKHADHFYCEYDKEMDDAFHLRQYIVTHLDEAVKKGYIEAHYQPVVWAHDRSLCGLEALARWNDPTYGFLSPKDFIPVLEEYRLIPRLDKAIFEIVLRDLRAGIKAGKKVVPVSVNFSRIDFELSEMKKKIDKLISKYEVPPELIHVELTESALTLNDKSLKATIQILKNMGFQLWLDDFGSGYSSLNMLKDYSFDVMKIDMVFLKHFGENDKSKTILQSIVNLADSINMETLTEGVEEEEQAEFLKSIGCKRLQGYLFGKAMPKDELKEKYECF